MFKKKKPHLLVVGGTGFIGYHLILAAKKKKLENINHIFKQA